VPLVKRQRRLQEHGERPRPVRVGAGDCLQRGVCVPQCHSVRSHVVGVRNFNRDGASQDVHIAVIPGLSPFDEQLLEHVELPGLRRQGIQAGRRAIVRPLLDQDLEHSDQGFPLLIRQREGLLALGAGLRERVLREDQVVEAEDRRERVVQLRGALVQGRAQFVVGQERPV
jgi:hypothetical protein